MKTNLTVTINRDLVTAAERYAKSHSTTLSQLIEDSLRAAISKRPSEESVQSLAGLLREEERRPVTLDEMDRVIQKARSM